ncbi:MAG: CBS domain-containing protein [Gammaproteobacteria bacterium]|nr:CBS domain-containing protein [Gammaproteobacteria bacterium]
MELSKYIIQTEVARPGMTFGSALRECVDKGVPGIPYVDSNEVVVGRFSIRNAFLHMSIPGDIVKGAHLLGDTITHMSIVDLGATELLASPIDSMIMSSIVHLNPASPALKALALMEKYHTNYLFLMEDREYLGVITRLGIAKLILEARDQD